MNLQPLYIREVIIKAIREFFDDLHFHEVITPTMNDSLPLEPNIYPFETSWKTVQGNQSLYLSTSPEAGLKKMLGYGMGSCFAISKAFRNLEDASCRHIPEFLMLEWYRDQATYMDIMKEVQLLIVFINNRVDTFLSQAPEETVMYQGKKVVLEGEWRKHSMEDLFQTYAHLSLREIIDDEKMVNAAKQKGYSTEHATWEQLFNQIFLNEIEPHLGINPCFVTDFPSRISPLCAVKKVAPEYAERFEFYMAGMELANGNTENTNTETIHQVFTREEHERKKKKNSTAPIDMTFLTSLDKLSNGSYAGIGLGIDRLAMILADCSEIKQVEPLSIS